MKLFFAAIIAIAMIHPSHVFSQCPVKKTAKHYGFFRATNFKDKICWLSEPFAYNDVNGKVENYTQLKECFIKKVEASGGDLSDAANVVWLNNAYNPNDELSSSYNFWLPSIKSCIPYLKNEIKYKTNVGIEVKIVKMFDDGFIDPNNVDLDFNN